jgi:hypothetical protein
VLAIILVVSITRCGGGGSDESTIEPFELLCPKYTVDDTWVYGQYVNSAEYIDAKAKVLVNDGVNLEVSLSTGTPSTPSSTVYSYTIDQGSIYPYSISEYIVGGLISIKYYSSYIPECPAPEVGDIYQVDSYESTVTSISYVTLTVPAGQFNTVKVVTDTVGDDPGETIKYFASEIGLVRSISYSSSGSYELLLKSYELQ